MFCGFYDQQRDRRDLLTIVTTIKYTCTIKGLFHEFTCIGYLILKIVRNILLLRILTSYTLYVLTNHNIDYYCVKEVVFKISINFLSL